MRTWGRIGTDGQEKVEVFDCEEEAGEALEAGARAKRRQAFGSYGRRSLKSAHLGTRRG
nr:WGR domain-containing protein [Microvirga vignae]